MSRRLLIHPGLHKTGTTTLQNTLRENRPLLDPHVEMMLSGEVVQMMLTGACKEFSLHRNKATKAVIRDEALALFEAVDPDDPRPLLISNESLGGYELGYKNIFSFAALPKALEIIVQAWRDVMGHDARAEVYLSTRRNGWLRSCWWQRLKSDRFRMPFDVFEKRYGQAADHDAFVAQCREGLGGIPLHRHDVEDSDHPAHPVLDLLGLGHLRGDLTIPPNRNVAAPDDAHAKMLDLNRSNLKGPDYWAAKRAIMGVEKGAEDE